MAIEAKDLGFGYFLGYSSVVAGCGFAAGAAFVLVYQRAKKRIPVARDYDPVDGDDSSDDDDEQAAAAATTASDQWGLMDAPYKMLLCVNMDLKDEGAAAARSSRLGVAASRRSPEIPRVAAESSSRTERASLPPRRRDSSRARRGLATTRPERVAAAAPPRLVPCTPRPRTRPERVAAAAPPRPRAPVPRNSHEAPAAAPRRSHGISTSHPRRRRDGPTE